MGSRRAVFLDRDGTLNVDTGYVHTPEAFAWIPGAVDAVRRLRDAGLLTIVVTNQAGIARGYYTEADMHRLHAHVADELQRAGTAIDAFYHAPYHEQGVVPAFTRAHPDRKPGTGLFERAIREHNIDPGRSFMVGDKASDIVPAHALGITSFLVETGYGRAERDRAGADYVVTDVGEAATRILALLGGEAGSTTRRSRVGKT